MKTGNRSNALLVELLIVVMFFMLSSTVLLQIFSTARSQSALSGQLNAAMNEAQNMADRLYAAQDPESELREMECVQEDGLWRLPGDSFDLTVSVSRDEQAGGELVRCQVRAVSNGNVLVDLPSARYQEAAK